MGFPQIQRFLGVRGKWRTDSATNLCSKAFDSCKLPVYIWLLGTSPATITGALPLDPAGGPLYPRSPVPTLTSELGYTTGPGNVRELTTSWELSGKILQGKYLFIFKFIFGASPMFISIVIAS